MTLATNKIQGDEIYLSETAGTFTNTRPSTSLSIVRVVGYSLSTTEFFFNPGSTYTLN
jgi:hypothetical protein